MDERTISVLIADDTADVRALLRLALERDGAFDVVGEAVDGQQAVDLARALQPELVLLDLAMPVLDGMRALPGIRDAAPEVRVVVLSAFEEQAVGKEALAAGAAAYVQKGQPLKALLARLRQVCDMAESPPIGVPSGSPAPDSSFDFLAMTVHELRNPIGLIQGFSETVLSYWSDLAEDEKQVMIERVLHQAGRLRRLVDDLLVVSRLDGGSLVVETRPVLLDALVRPVAEGIEAGDGLVIEFHGASDVEVLVDPARTEQILVNLFTNAFRHGEPPVVVHISTEPEGPMVEIAVTDAGQGVPPESRDHLFERFTPLARSRPDSTGLGLYIVRSLARAQGGDVWYEDADPGARFVVSVPAASPRRATT